MEAVKKNKSAYLITVTSEREGKRAFSLRVTRGALIAISVFFCVAIVAAGALFYTAAETARLYRLYGEARNENEKLTKENILLQQITVRVGRMDSLAAYLEQLAVPARTQERQTLPAAHTEAPAVAREPAGSPSAAVPAFDMLPVDGWITQKYIADTTGGQEHPGIDIAAPAGTNIVAPAPGTVASVTDDRYYGKLIIIDHAGGYQTRYGHCKAVFVSAREQVGRGQIIALVGSTGNSTAPHLHYEILKNGKNSNPLDILQTARK